MINIIQYNQRQSVDEIVWCNLGLAMHAKLRQCHNIKVMPSCTLSLLCLFCIYSQTMFLPILISWVCWMLNNHCHKWSLLINVLLAWCSGWTHNCTHPQKRADSKYGQRNSLFLRKKVAYIGVHILYTCTST